MKGNFSQAWSKTFDDYREERFERKKIGSYYHAF